MRKYVDFDRQFIALERDDQIDSHINQSIKGNEVLILAERQAVSGKFAFANPNISNGQMRQFFQYAKTGGTFSFWVNREQGPYLGFEGATLTTNNSQAGTTVRSTVGYYTNYYDENLDQAAANKPRFEAGKFGAGLLNEKASVNWITNAQFAPWVSASASFSKIGYVNDPTDSTTLAQLVEINDNTGGFIFTTNRLVSLATKGCFSMYARAYDRTLRAELLLTHDTGSPAIQTALMELTSDWQRFHVATLNHAYTGSANWRCDFYLYGATGDKAIFAFPQFEETSWPTSYMLTAGNTFARAIEHHHFPIVADDDIEPSKGTLLFWVKPLFQRADDSVNVFVLIEDASGRDFLKIWKDASGDLRLTMGLADGTSNPVSMTVDPSAFMVVNTWVRLAVTWNLNTSNGVSVYANGVVRGVSTNDAFTPVQSPSIVRIGDSSDSGSFVIDELEILKYAMSASDASSDSSLNRGRGIGQNFFSNMQLVSSSWSPKQRPGRPYYEFDLNMIEYQP